jgi:hypothetical protein
MADINLIRNAQIQASSLSQPSLQQPSFMKSPQLLKPKEKPKPPELVGAVKPPEIDITKTENILKPVTFFKPPEPEFVGAVKPKQKPSLIIGQFESYDPLKNIQNPYKRASFKLQSTIDKLSASKYRDTGRPIQDNLIGAASSLAIIPVAAQKRATDIIAFLGDIGSGDYKNRERVPIQYKPGEIITGSEMKAGERVYSSLVTRPEQFVGEVATDFALFGFGQNLLRAAKIPTFIKKPQIQFVSRDVPISGKKAIETKFITTKPGKLSSWMDRQVSSIEIVKGKPVPAKNLRVEGINYFLPVDKTGKVISIKPSSAKSSDIYRLREPTKPFVDKLRLTDISNKQKDFIKENFKKFVPDSELQIYSTPPTTKFTTGSTKTGKLKRSFEPLSTDISQVYGRQTVTYDGQARSSLIDELSLNVFRQKQISPGITKVNLTELGKQKRVTAFFVDKQKNFINNFKQLFTSKDKIIPKKIQSYDPTQLIFGKTDDVTFLGAYFKKVKPIGTTFTSAKGTAQTTQYQRLSPIKLSEQFKQIYPTSLQPPKDLKIIDIATGKPSFTKAFSDIGFKPIITPPSKTTTGLGIVSGQAQKTISSMEPLTFLKTENLNLRNIANQFKSTLHQFSKGTTQGQQQTKSQEQRLFFEQEPLKQASTINLNFKNLFKDRTKTMNLSNVFFRQGQKFQQDSTQKSLSDQESIQDTIPITDTTNIPGLRQADDQAAIQGVGTITGVTTITRQAQKNILDFTNIYPNIPTPKIPTFKIVTPRIKTPLIPKIKLKKRASSDEDSVKDLEQAFDISVRTRGKWTKVDTPRTLNFYAAKQKGMQIVDNYAERSLRLTPTKKNAQVRMYNEPINAYKFDFDKSKSGKLKRSYIEKSRFAIDKQGELRGITYKGIQANERKRKNFLSKF